MSRDTSKEDGGMTGSVEDAIRALDDMRWNLTGIRPALRYLSKTWVAEAFFGDVIDQVHSEAIGEFP